MALTPLLAEAGEAAGRWLDAEDASRRPGSGFDDELCSPEALEGRDVVVICGFGPVGQIVAGVCAS